MSRSCGIACLLGLAVVAGCTTASPASTDAGAHAPSAPLEQTTKPVATGAVSALDPTASAHAGDPAMPRASHTGPMARFHDALRELEGGARKAHVRILWLGDSHAQADFWTGHVRRALQQRFGHGGPGFVHLGYKDYRHEGVEVEVEGGWRMRPKRPSGVEPWGDGAFGLGGILHAGFQGQRSATIALTDERLSGRDVVVDLCVKAALEHDQFRLHVGDADAELVGFDGAADVGAIRHLERRARAPFTLKVAIRDGRPDFCGVVLETDPAERPGVVLDNLGINGARYATALAWNEDAWGKEVARRPPELFVFEYGGNEASDGAIKPEEYRQNALDLIARTRRISPQASCLVIGPADRADAEAKIPPIVAAVRAAAGDSQCMFWDTYQVMGGQGSLRRWREDERAAEDGVHLKPKGYEELGALLLQDLMRGYRR